ncbi:MAG: hypothetical protein CVV33_00435 [Methanomicrobiales archaeon HGW-Methanomicrobiales-4]|nr:MAG: hypothetical protein CVV33_00435 [Methanomicrobiales archaeon HGW-Methanomicrobiales-4]
MKYQLLFTGLILLLLTLTPVYGFEIREGDNIVIDTPIHDDLLASGGSVTINAPVKSLTFAGGTLIVNAPIEENLIAAGGQILVNAPVGVDIIAAGGKIDITSDIGGKVLAAGGHVTMNGEASNVAISGGTVNLGNTSHVTGDALISASGYTTRGLVEGNLTAEGDKGGFGPSFDLHKAISLMSTIVMVMQILFAIGMLILGIILIRMIPTQFREVSNTVRNHTLMSLVSGVAGVIIAFFLIMILLITLIGIPIAVIIGLVFLIGLMTSTIFSGTALGIFITEKMGREFSLIVSFIIGFIILEIIFIIPILGFFIKIIAVFIGLGALIMTTWKMIESQN